MTNPPTAAPVAPRATFPLPAFLTPAQLSERWLGAVSVVTIKGWRMRDEGPKPFYIGHKVLYRLVDVQLWEEQQAKRGWRGSAADVEAIEGANAAEDARPPEPPAPQMNPGALPPRRRPPPPPDREPPTKG